ncbi:MAG TPA: FAD-dependent oxidoreductase, partial [Gemmatimonadota bacterium]|nr:FAD-dependent oxidoreductase [Gemmatimonadota bacterium]
LGVDVFFGGGRFGGADRVEVGGATLVFRRAVLATGSRPALPPIPGLAEAGFLTNETVFDLAERPARLAVIGGGAIGCELAQAFARLGSRVTLLESGPRLLPRDDPDAAAVVVAALSRDGVDVRTGIRIERVEPADAAARLAMAGEALEADRILVATGRVPNVEDAGLDAAGIESGPGGVRVDDRLRTTNPRVWAAGDVVGPLRFTHLSDAHARIAVRNALFPGSAKASDLVVPWVTYTDPEVAHVGHTPESAAEAGIEVDTFTVELRDVDRAILDGTTGGFVRVHARKGKGEIVGATLVAPHAGETIGEVTLAMTAGIGLAKLSETIHPYPTVAEALRRTGDAHRRKSLTPRAKWVIEKWLAWRR